MTLIAVLMIALLIAAAICAGGVFYAELLSVVGLLIAVPVAVRTGDEWAEKRRKAALPTPEPKGPEPPPEP